MTPDRTPTVRLFDPPEDYVRHLGPWMDARIVLGAVGPTAMRARAAERGLRGQPLTAPALREAGRAAAGECRPISDVRASARYRALLVATLVERALACCGERIRQAA